MIPQVHERREHIVAQPARVRRGGAGRDCRDLRARKTILELEHDPLGRFLADAGDPGEARDVAMLDRAHQLDRLDPREHRERELRPDPADANQALEQLLLQQRGEPVQRDRIFAHVRVNPQRDIGIGIAKTVERRERHEDVVADAVDVHDDAVRMFFEDAAAEMGDHVVLGPQYVVPGPFLVPGPSLVLGPSWIVCGRRGVRRKGPRTTDGPGTTDGSGTKAQGPRTMCQRSGL